MLATCVSVNEESQVEEVESSVHDVEVQTEETAGEIANLRSELNSAYETIYALQSSLQPFTESSLLNRSILHYTGLPNLINAVKNTFLGVNSCILLKLRLNVLSQDLAHCFDIHTSTVPLILLCELRC